MSSEKIIFGPFVLDLKLGLLMKEGKRVPVRPQALNLLIYLAKNQERVVPREELYDAIWPGNNVDEDQSLNVVIKGLRESLGDSPRQSTFVETVPRRGYRFIGALSESTRKKGKPKTTFKRAALVFATIMGVFLFAANYFGPQPQNLVTINDLSATAQAQFLEGIQQIEEGKYDESRETFTAVTISEPNFAEGHLWLARSSSWVPGLRLDAANQAKPHYLKALELNSDNTKAMAELGMMLLVTDFDAKGAVNLAEQTLALESQNPRAFMLLGLAELALGNPKGASKYFNEVSVIDPTLVDFSARVGWTYYMAGELEEAARLCRILLRAGTDSNWVRLCLFESYLAMGELELAMAQAFGIMKTTGLTEPEITKILGDDPILSLKKFDVWQMAYLKSLELDTSYGQVFVNLRLGNKEEAFKKLQEVVRQRHFPYFLTINSDPRLDFFRNHPEADTVFLNFK